jgi:hypothetical protein
MNMWLCLNLSCKITNTRTSARVHDHLQIAVVKILHTRLEEDEEEAEIKKNKRVKKMFQNFMSSLK